MKKETIRKKLENKGYSIKLCISGNYIAEKHQRTYTSSSLNGLYNQIFKNL
jgi:hypothetical protein